MIDELSWGVVFAVGTALVVWAYLRRVEPRAPRRYAAAVGVMTLGVVLGGTTRFLLPMDSVWPSAAGALIATLALCCATMTVHQSWRQIVTDTMLVSVAPFVAAYTVLLIAVDAPDTVRQNVDALCAALAWFFAGLLVVMSRRVTLPTRTDRVLLASFGLLRAAAWTVVAQALVAVAEQHDAGEQRAMPSG